MSFLILVRNILLTNGTTLPEERSLRWRGETEGYDSYYERAYHEIAEVTECIEEEIGGTIASMEWSTMPPDWEHFDAEQA